MLTRRQLIASGTGLLLAGSLSRARAQSGADLAINSTRFISTNADTGAVFAQRGAHDQVAIASLTKVFTAMEALSTAPLDTQITTTSDDMQPSNATVMGFGPGETFTLEELMYGMMLPSGNDAAYAIARSLGHQEGDTAQEAVQRFMDRVNRRVLAMGLENTNLLNPDGWGVPGHYSSAADVAAFMSYASSSDFLLRVMGTYSYTTRAGYVLTNTNRTLTTAPSVLAGKTGYDGDSGWCLVQIAQRDNTRIIAVNLDGVAPGDWYNDNLILLDYGFNQQTALGANPYDGEHVTWSDPTPWLFAQSGSSEVQLSGATEANEEIVIREEAQLPRIPVERKVASARKPVVLDNGRNNGILAGIGATILAGAMAATRWGDFGGDRTTATISPSIGAATASLKRTLPSFPSFSRANGRDDDVIDKDDLSFEDDESDPDQV